MGAEQSVSFAGSPSPAHILSQLFLAGVPVLPGGCLGILPLLMTCSPKSFSRVWFPFQMCMSVLYLLDIVLRAGVTELKRVIYCWKAPVINMVRSTDRSFVHNALEPPRNSPLRPGEHSWGWKCFTEELLFNSFLYLYVHSHHQRSFNCKCFDRVI